MSAVWRSGSRAAASRMPDRSAAAHLVPGNCGRVAVFPRSPGLAKGEDRGGLSADDGGAATAGDPVMRQVMGGRAVDAQAATAPLMGQFETETLAMAENRAALVDPSGHLRRDPPIASATALRVTAIRTQTERKLQDGSARRAEKRRGPGCGGFAA